MAYVPLPNQAKVNRAANRLVKISPTTSVMPYTLHTGAANSDAYYHTISVFADDWLLHMQDVAVIWLTISKSSGRRLGVPSDRSRSARSSYSPSACCCVSTAPRLPLCPNGWRGC